MDNYSDKELLEEIEKRLNESKKGLTEYHGLAKQLKVVNQKLRESEGMKSHFLSNITNEIVNPFASILGLSENIIALKEGNWDRVRSMAALIHSEAFDLDFQLKNIFAAAKIESGELIPSCANVEISMLIESVLAAFKYKARQKELSIDFQYLKGEGVDERGRFKTDPEKVKLIIANLLSNSIKFSNAANKIILKVWYDNGSLKVMIQDFGVGIKDKDLKIIFDRFKKVDTTINSVIPGHGLGLSVSKSLIDILGGTIEISSKFGHGTKSDISIPEAHCDEDITGFATDDNEFFFGEEETF